MEVDGFEIAIGGLRYWAVPMDSPAEQKARKADAAVKKQAPKPQGKAAKAPDARMPIDGPAAKILALLEKKPMSSIEIIEATRLESAQVYNAAHNLKKAGRVESVLDPADETRRYRLVKPASGSQPKH